MAGFSKEETRHMRDAEKHKAYMRVWHSKPENKAKNLENGRAWHSKPENRLKRAKSSLKRYYKNRDKISLIRKLKYSDPSNAEKKKLLAEKRKLRLQNNPELKAKISLRNRIYNSKKKTKLRINQYRKDRKSKNQSFYLACRLRVRIAMAIRYSGAKKSSKTNDLCGCDISFLKNYLEARFLPGMNWENRSEWHIDHIIPCKAFDLSNPEQQKKCFHYSNLRPLWVKDNLRKNGKMPQPHQAELL
jgi:hypothetical protein